MHKLRISVGIPAFNEEKTIKKLLYKILKQKGDYFVLEQILVGLDGCEDRTLDKVIEVKDKRIITLISRKRQGKWFQLNRIFKESKCDVLVLLDADVEIVSFNFINSIAEEFIKYKNLGMVACDARPAEAVNFTEQSVNLTFRAYDKMRKIVNEGHNVFSVKGCAVAISGKLAKEVKIPKNVPADDAFLYFSCLKQGYSFRYSKKSKVIFKSPSTVIDQIKQNRKFVSSIDSLKPYFGDEVSKHFSYPSSEMRKIMLQEFFKAPVHAIFIFLVNALSKINLFNHRTSTNVLWDRVDSTKGLV